MEIESLELKKMERATGIEPVLPAWESKLPLLYFHNLQNRLGKINVHALHTVPAVPELRVAGGRLGDDFSSRSGVCDALFGGRRIAAFETL